MTTTKPKPTATTTDVLADRPRWQRDGDDGFLPKLPTIRWQRLDDLRERHVALVADLRTVVEVGDQGAEEKILAELGDVVTTAARQLFTDWHEGEACFKLAAEAVTVKGPPTDGWDLAPRPASPDGSADPVDVYNERAEKFAEDQRKEAADLAPARAAFDAETETWRALYRRLEPVYLRDTGAVSVDVFEVERHRGKVVSEA